MADKPIEKKIIFNTELVSEATRKINDGIILKRFQNPWLAGEVGIRRSGVTFRMSQEEQAEYVKCALDVHYFAEKYCKVKTEDGSVNNIYLRDYQEEILNCFRDNRFSILMASRQTGKTITSAIFMLHTILFNNDKNIMIVANLRDTTIEILDKIKSIYTMVPFFLKPGVKVWNQKSLVFDNNCRIKTAARSKTPAIGFTIDLLYLDEFAHIPSNIIVPYYTAAFPTVSAISNSKIIITSTPNGMNLFHKILTDAERPEGDPQKNNFKAMRVYWHQVPNRFVTYLRLNNHRLQENELTKEEMMDICKKMYSDRTNIDINFNMDLQKDIISIYNNEVCSDEEIKKATFLNKKGIDVPFSLISEVTTWKDEAIKDIGGLEAFNQEYGLRFISSSNSLLNESLIDELIKGKKNFKFEPIDELDRKLKFSYKDLKWIDDDSVFMPVQRNDARIVMTVDISEGLNQDYSVINIFKTDLKPLDIIELQKKNYTNIVDFFRLTQIGIFRSNIISVKQLSELLYLLAFEYFNFDNVKIVLEVNTYGNELLAHLPHVFDGNNNYGSFVFYRYKHRSDATEEKIGLKVGENKNIMVKDYQDLMESRSFSITNEDNIREITAFVKHITTSGNIQYRADIGNDDSVMTIVNATTAFKKNDFREVCQEIVDKMLDSQVRELINSILKESDYRETVDYGQVLTIRKQQMQLNRWKQEAIQNNNAWTGNRFK